MSVFSHAELAQFIKMKQNHVIILVEQATPLILKQILPKIDKNSLALKMIAACSEGYEFRCQPIEVFRFHWDEQDWYPASDRKSVFFWRDIVWQPAFLQRFANFFGSANFLASVVREDGDAVMKVSFYANGHGREKESKCLFSRTGFEPLDHQIDDKGVCSCCGSYSTEWASFGTRWDRHQKATTAWIDMMRHYDAEVKAAQKQREAVLAVKPENWAAACKGLAAFQPSIKAHSDAKEAAQAAISQALRKRRHAANDFVFND